MKKTIITTLLMALLYSCNTYRHTPLQYPKDLSQSTNYNVKSWKVNNKMKSNSFRRVMAEWETPQGIVIAYPFDVPIQLLKELGEETKIYILVTNNESKSLAIKELQNNIISLKNIFFIKSKSIKSIHNIAFWGLQDTSVNNTFQGKFNNSNRLSYFRIKQNKAKMIKSKAILDGESVLFDGKGAMYIDKHIFDANKSFKNLERLSNSIYSDFSIKELLFVPLLDSNSKLCNEMRLIAPKTYVLREKETKTNNFLKNINPNNLKTFFWFEDIKPSYFYIKESLQPSGLTSYINSFIFNDKLFVPLYGYDSDGYALQTWKEIMPNYKIIGCKLEANQRPWAEGDCLYNRIKIIH